MIPLVLPSSRRHGQSRGRRGPLNVRRTSAPKSIAGAFFVLAMPLYGGRVIGSAIGFPFAYPPTSADDVGAILCKGS